MLRTFLLIILTVGLFQQDLYAVGSPPSHIFLEIKLIKAKTKLDKKSKKIRVLRFLPTTLSGLFLCSGCGTNYQGVNEANGKVRTSTGFIDHLPDLFELTPHDFSGQTPTEFKLLPRKLSQIHQSPEFKIPFLNQFPHIDLFFPDHKADIYSDNIKVFSKTGVSLGTALNYKTYYQTVYRPSDKTNLPFHLAQSISNINLTKIRELGAVNPLDVFDGMDQVGLIESLMSEVIVEVEKHRFHQARISETITQTPKQRYCFEENYLRESVVRVIQADKNNLFADQIHAGAIIFNTDLRASEPRIGCNF